jgi:redox-sensitive bicupin YhaK (pirin superfamily)
MSYTDAHEADCTECQGAIALRVVPREADLGEFTVRRVLPARSRRMVGPFVFFDHMGPAEFPPGKGIAVRPHPHIGLATITYLFAGEIVHRDSLGVVQTIAPGAVNLMTAGRGIVHSERAGSDLDEYARLHGIQSWIALPENEQEIAPDFTHYPREQLPDVDLPGATVRVIMGEAYGAASPVHCYSPTLYLECRLEAGATLSLPGDHPELALYVAEGAVAIDSDNYPTGNMAVACPYTAVKLQAREASRVMVIGGEPLGERHIHWNFVSTSRDRIEQARQLWRDGGFPTVPGDDERIPLPD